MMTKKVNNCRIEVGVMVHNNTSSHCDILIVVASCKEEWWVTMIYYVHYHSTCHFTLNMVLDNRGRQQFDYHSYILMR